MHQWSWYYRVIRFHQEADWARKCYDFLVSVDDRHVTAENRLVSWLALWDTLTGFVSITKFPPFGASLPLYKEEQLVVDSKTPVGNGMPVVSLLVLFSNYVYVHPFRKIYDNFSPPKFLRSFSMSYYCRCMKFWKWYTLALTRHNYRSYSRQHWLLYRHEFNSMERAKKDMLRGRSLASTPKISMESWIGSLCKLKVHSINWNEYNSPQLNPTRSKKS